MKITADPFAPPLRHPWIPREMIEAPLLDAATTAGPLEARYALLINPFYPKDPNSSFGKHVLTPTLALTSFAAATPEHWRVAYWDENLLDGRPPFEPMPELVGISVHLTFARRAFELAEWYRRRGSKVVWSGLHVLSCPEECAPHADVLAVGDGVQLWPRSSPTRRRAACNHATRRPTKTNIAGTPRPGAPSCRAIVFSPPAA